MLRPDQTQPEGTAHKHLEVGSSSSFSEASRPVLNGSNAPLKRDTLGPATPIRKRGKSMSFRSGQSGTVVRKGQMWHGRYYVDIPGEEKRRKASVPLASIHTMKKPEAKRKLRSFLEQLGLNSQSHLERYENAARTFASEVAWWKQNRLPIFKLSCQETMGSHLDKYLLPRF